MCHLVTRDMSVCPWYSMSLYHLGGEASKTLAAAWARLEATQSAWKEELLGGTEHKKVKSEVHENCLH